MREAHFAGTVLRRHGFRFDRIYTSVLIRCTESARIIGSELLAPMPQIVKCWRLNERHYGALQGLNKAETAARLGSERVRLWRRSYDVRPPSLDDNDPSNPASDPKYSDVPRELLPLTESLADVVARVVPFWTQDMAPAIRQGCRVLLVAHGNTIRALMKHLEGISDAAIVDLNVATGQPVVYELDADMRPVRRYEVGGRDKVTPPSR